MHYLIRFSSEFSREFLQMFESTDVRKDIENRKLASIAQKLAVTLGIYVIKPDNI